KIQAHMGFVGTSTYPAVDNVRTINSLAGFFSVGLGGAQTAARFQRRDEARCARFNAGLGAVRTEEGSGRRAKCSYYSLRRYRSGRLVPIRWTDQHADNGSVGREWFNLYAVA